MNTTKELLNHNKKALQFLHHANGFNFQKPFSITKFDNVITYNKFEKAVNYSRASDNCAILAISEFINYDGIEKCDMYYIDIYNSNFEPLRKIDVKYWKYNVNYFHTKGSFNEKRKNNKLTYFIIKQDKAHYTKPKGEKTIEFDKRYKFISKGYLTHYPSLNKDSITKIEVSHGDTKENLFYKVQNGYYLNKDNITTDINYFIDKSGYFKAYQRENYKLKVQTMKNEKAQAKASIYNCDKENTQIKNDIEKLKAVFVNAVQNDDIKTLDVFNYRYQWIIRDFAKHLQKYKNKEYNTISNIITTISNIQNDIFKINEKLKEV